MSVQNYPAITTFKQIVTPVFFALSLMLLIFSNSFADRNYGPVKINDFLGKIVSKSYTNSSLTKDQIMVAILRKNPAAFRGGNIHFLRRDMNLILPDESYISQIPSDEASALVAEHLAFFKQGKTGNFDALSNSKTSKNEEAVTTDTNTTVHKKSIKESSTTPAEIPTKIKIDIRKQTQEQANKLKHVKSLETIRDQQNKTLHSLDEQIRILEDQLEQDNKTADKKNTTIDQQKPDDSSETKEVPVETIPKQKNSSASDLETHKATEEDSTADNAISSLEAMIGSTPTVDSAHIDDKKPTTDEAPVNTSSIIEKPEEVKPQTSLENTPVEKKTSSDITKNTKTIILLTTLILGLSALGYFFFRQKTQESTIVDTPFEKPTSKPSLKKTVDIPSQENLLNPVIKSKPSISKPVKDASANEQDSEIKINMARAYMDMGYIDAARESLEEVLTEGTEEQKNTVQQMLSML